MSDRVSAKAQRSEFCRSHDKYHLWIRLRLHERRIQNIPRNSNDSIVLQLCFQNSFKNTADGAIETKPSSEFHVCQFAFDCIDLFVCATIKRVRCRIIGYLEAPLITR